MARKPALPRVIAHRGASWDCPENTLSAFDEALRQGCDAMELDVQLSRDGVPFVYHDRTLAKAGGGRRRVHRLDAAELARLDAGAWFGERFRGERIPRLDAVLSRYGKRTRLLIELKSREERPRGRQQALAAAVATSIREAGLAERTFCLSFDLAVLDALATCAPEIPRVLNLRPPRALGSKLARRLPALDALCVDVARLTPGFAAAVREAGTPLLVYTCNTAERVRRALDAGASGVISDRPAWLAEHLGHDARAPA
jgi:glycerophosphoryl diester phosphodiesterase